MVDRVTITVTPSFSLVDEKLKRFRRVGLENLRRPVDSIGDDVEGTVKARIAKRQDFEGKSIRPLKQSTIDRRKRRGTGGDHPLRETAKLQRSIVHKTEVKPDKTVVTIGPRGSRGSMKGNNPLMNIHHRGARRGNWVLPKRQPMGLNTRNIREIKRELEKHIRIQFQLVR